MQRNFSRVPAQHLRVNRNIRALSRSPTDSARGFVITISALALSRFHEARCEIRGAPLKLCARFLNRPRQGSSATRDERSALFRKFSCSLLPRSPPRCNEEESPSVVSKLTFIIAFPVNLRTFSGVLVATSVARVYAPLSSPDYRVPCSSANICASARLAAVGRIIFK